MSVNESEGAEAAVSDEQLELAQHIAALSETPERGKLPKGAQPRDVPEPFEAEDIDFTTESWLDRIVQVQAWLWLDAPLKPNASPADLAESLFRGLANEGADDCFKRTETGVRVTSTGYRTLIDRASLAVQNREYFVERIEDLDDYAAASKEWLDRWQDGDTFGGSTTGHVNATVETWHIYTIRNCAQENSLELNPSYQRDVVWTNGESQKLIESILKGIPLPSVILSMPPGKEHYEIVDGKQRLTSILRFIGKHPKALAAVRDLAPEEDRALFETDYPQFFTKYLRGRKELTPYLPFKIKIKPGEALHHLDGLYYCKALNKKVQLGDKVVTVRHLFEGPTSPYKLPMIVYQDTDIRTIHEVFGLYNKQGKHLNAEELRNATYHELGMTRLLIVLSGDRSDDAAHLAPFLVDADTERLSEVSELLTNLCFGTARFKRTKVLSWALAIMMQAPPRKDGTYATPSTAKHIDAMLDALISDPGRLMNQPKNLAWLATTVLDAIELHADHKEAWANRFRNKKGLASKWEELPVVASLITTILLVIDDQGELLADHLPQIRKLTESIPPLEGAQNSTQWGWVAGSVLQVLEQLGTDLDGLGAKCASKLGHDCLPILQAIDAAFPAARKAD